MTVCLSMIVKNEAKVIKRCLNSVFRSIDHAVIVDTGSNDGTHEEVSEWAWEHGRYVECAWYERPWVDFSTNRNQALDLARAKPGMNTGDWILVQDADDVFHGVIDAAKLDPSVDGYMIRFVLGDLEFLRPALIRADAAWQYYFKVHELLLRRRDDALDLPVLEDVWVECNVGGEFQGKEYFLEHARLLEGEDDPRSVFYLGQSYQCAGETHKAIEAYSRRTQMEGYLEEKVLAWLRIGELADDPGAYLEAAALNTSRGEGLLRAARWCRDHGLRQVAITLAAQAATKTKPHGMFLERGTDAHAVALLAELLRSS